MILSSSDFWALMEDAEMAEAARSMPELPEGQGGGGEGEVARHEEALREMGARRRAGCRGICR